jgi:competence protein ComEC
MQTGKWLLIGLLVACVNLMIVEKVWWPVFGFLWFGVLFWRHFGNHWWQLTICLCGSLLFFCSHNLMIAQSLKQPVGQVAGRLVVKPDDLLAKGQTVSGTGVWRQERVRFQVFCQEQATFDYLANTKQTVVMMIDGDLSQIPPPRNRHAFDGQRYWQSRGICRQLVIQKVTDIRVATPKHFWEFFCWQVSSWHKQGILWFETCPPTIRDYGQALLLGVMRPGFFEDNSGIKELGLMHLFSISGFQVVAVYSGWRRFGRLVGLTRETNLYVLQGLLVTFWLFAGGVQSLIRAVLLGIFQTWRELRWLRIAGVDIWGWSLIGGLCFEPGVLSHLGGQLSYLLTFGLLWTADHPGWFQSIWLSILISPTLMWHTYIWQPAAMLANVIAVPVFSWAVIPFTIIGALGKVTGLSLVTTGCDWWLGRIRWVIATTGNLAPEVVVGKPNLGLVCFGTLAGLCLLLPDKRRLASIFLMMSLCGQVAWCTWCPIGKVTFFDVGQADATLIKRPGGDTLMVDVGGRLAFPKPRWVKKPASNFDVTMLVDYCHASGIRRIDELVLTHKDVDHLGNFNDFVQAFPVDRVYVPAGLMQTTAGQQLRHPRIIEITATNLPTWACLHPFEAGTGENEDSIVVSVQTGPYRLMLMGDLYQAGEQTILQRVAVKQHDILKFGHHGSKTSTSPDWVNALRPRVGIVSSGRQNRFGHPNIETLHTAQQAGMTVYNTAVHGMIEYSWLGKKTWWEVMIDGNHVK